jgi:hypothetical protein
MSPAGRPSSPACTSRRYASNRADWLSAEKDWVASDISIHHDYWMYIDLTTLLLGFARLWSTPNLSTKTSSKYVL